MGTQVGKKFAWVIKNFSSLECKICYSAPVLIGDRKWRLYAYPKGDNCDYLSLYLEVVDWKSLPSGWRRFVKLRLSVVKQSYDIDSVMKETHRWFDKKISCWGFPLIPLTKLHDEREGFLEDGDLIVVAEVDVLQVVGTSDEPGESKDGSSNLKIITGDDGVPESNDYLKIKVASFGTGNMDINGFQVLPSQGKEQSSLVRLQEMEDNLLELKQKCSDLDALVEKEEAELSAIRTPLSFDDVV
ncbi:hypothetical protein YC2023_091246 [Brassica napus]